MGVLLCICLLLTVYIWTVTALRVKNVLGQTGLDVTSKRHAAEGEVKYACGEKRCVCQGTHADCDFTYLTYIPQLPSDITSLYFSSSWRSVVLRFTDDFFVNITTVTWLDLSWNTTAKISSNAFQILTNLAYLDVSGNNLTCDDLSAVFNIPTLEVLIISGLGCGRLEDVVVRRPMPRLQELIADNFGVLNVTHLMPFTGLRRITLRSTDKMVNVPAFHDMTNMTYLDVSHSTLSCDDLTNILTILTLKVLNVSGAKSCCAFPDIGTENPMPALEELNLCYPYLRTLNLTHLLPFTGLKRLHLQFIDTPNGPRIITMYKALHQLTNLAYLDLSFNKLSCADLWTVLTIPSLEEFKLRKGTVCTGTELLLNPSIQCVNKSRLAKLDLSHNDLDTVFIPPDLTELQHVDLSYNKISNIEFKCILFRLQTLNLRHNAIDCFIKTCMNGSSIFPSLLELDLSENRLYESFNEKTCLPHLQILNVSANYQYSDTFISLKRLKTTDITAQYHDFRYFIGEHSFNNSDMKSLNLSDDHIPFADETKVHSASFRGCPNLANLWLDNNDFTGINESRFQQLFGHLIHLTHLSLRSTGFSYITAGMFHSLTSLQYLRLGHNNLAVLPDAVFQSLFHLVNIDLSSNKIPVIQESTFTFITRQRLQYVDLRSNPFTCSCDVLWFQKWLINSPSVFAGRSTDYTCGNKHNTPVQSFFMQEQACLLSPETSKFIIATISLIFIGMGLMSFLYRYRWHIRLILHEVFRGPEERRRRLRENRFQYDVFVSYDSEDFPWVRDHLMPSLEEDMGLKLCIHQKDFIPGCPIVENIMDTVQSSKKLLMLFSRSFAQSRWCQFELQLCLTHAMDTQDVLIVVMLEHIPSRELTPAMMAIMKTTTYIEWADDAEARDSFWRRMGLSLHEILPVA